MHFLTSWNFIKEHKKWKTIKFRKIKIKIKWFFGYRSSADTPFLFNLQERRKSDELLLLKSGKATNNLSTLISLKMAERSEASRQKSKFEEFRHEASRHAFSFASLSHF